MTQLEPLFEAEIKFDLSEMKTFNLTKTRNWIAEAPTSVSTGQGVEGDDGAIRVRERATPFSR